MGRSGFAVDSRPCPYVLLIVAIMLAAARAASRLGSCGLWLPFLVFGLTSARAIMPAAIVLVPFAASVWRPTDQEGGRIRQNRFALNLVLAAALVCCPSSAWSDSKGSTKIAFLSRRRVISSADPVWHDDRTGGYLIYANRLPVFVDDRAELYGAEFFREFVDTRRGTPVWQVRPSSGTASSRCLVADRCGIGRGAHCRGLAGRLQR